MDETTFELLAQRVARRYAGSSAIGPRFARGKLLGDPVYRQVLDLLPSGGALVDIGCGQGLMLALVVEAGSPRFDRLIGIETRRNVAALARAALGNSAEIILADVRTMKLEDCTAALLFDVLHMMPADAQEQLIASLSGKLAPGGVMFVREADASAGWGFRFVRAVNRTKAILVGSLRQPFHFRSREGWVEFFRRLGLDAEVCATERPDPLGNILFRVRK